MAEYLSVTWQDDADVKNVNVPLKGITDTLNTDINNANNDINNLVQTTSSLDTRVSALEQGGSINKQEIINTIYPVGSIYITLNAISPNNLFEGTTWEQIQDTFLLASSSTVTANSTGGNKSLVLTVDNLPAHNHVIGPAATIGETSVSHTHTYFGSTESQSINHIHSVSLTTSSKSIAHTHTVSKKGNASLSGFMERDSSTEIGFAYGNYGYNNYSSYTTSSAGGSHTHTVSGNTGNTSVSHRHTFSGTTAANNIEHTHTISGSTQQTGSGSALDITPPYLAVYMWKRTA